ncbi:lysylphosphatidylglycerol synthase domain-containing protein [Blastopirellula sp. JC732]|uniref:Lysylphosphatidylglycerol synthase domain-containing protein n=1 Tax=Blastopirellula sediminis TaxID=2894196 RepID=A0A9X1SFB9_9BACT|nr:YbhN family protein [Blastopirellula sediminis]MCC9609085.1 lysylphosphatidylglycerol synthase domain-containing protein [Blastopirellula sediminis]MCC9628138.1 lysylphosphatidylglycerol synthase domain-containing protein [Blastopirellula sediminis]
MPEPSPKRSWKSWLTLAAKIVIFIVVVVGVWYNISKAVQDMRTHGDSVGPIQWGWLVAAGAIYTLASLPMASYWYFVLLALGQKPSYGKAVRAFFIGHLGKYVPGKAMVVVLRTSLVQGEHVEKTVAVVAVFIETLTMIAVGAAYSGVILAVLFREQLILLAIAAALGICAFVPTLPSIFRKVVTVLRVTRLNPRLEDHMQGLNYRLMGIGWFAYFIAWSLMGLSYLAAMQAIPGADAAMTNPWAALPLLISAVALAMIAGFVSLLPGGFGIRELILMQLTAPVFGRPVAVVGAVLLRVSWMVAEIVFSIILYVLPFAFSRRKAADAAVDESVPTPPIAR